MERQYKEEIIFEDMLEYGETKVNLNENSNVYEVEITSPSGEDAQDDDKKLYEFLETINMENLYPILKANQVTFRSLRYLKKEDLKEAVPPLGLRVEFREKLFAWKNSQLGMEEDSISIKSKVDEWLNKNENNAVVTQSNYCKCGKVLNKDLRTLLNETPKGRAILEYANKNQKLNCEHRNDIIGIIIDDVIGNNKILHAQDFIRLTDEICSVFPCEIKMKEYYHIPRKGKNNASGKLYSRYKNRYLKKRKLMITGESPSITNSQTSDNETADIDDSDAIALKNSLNKETTNWKDVCEKWKKTFYLRQKDIKNLESHEVLQVWSKLSDPRTPELISIDFDIKYPNKRNMLFSKWGHFKNKICKYYDENIHNEYCKQILSKITPATSIDSQDYIYTIMLNAVLPSPARFKNQTGKRSKRVTIADSQESLALRLSTLNDYEKQINEVSSKYYSAGLTIQPFIIVEGLHDLDIKGFYVYFNSNLLKFNSFIECLDACFKIFRTLSLKYPEACEQPWIFIQKFFYDISTKFDFKSANMSSLIHFFDTN